MDNEDKIHRPLPSSSSPAQAHLLKKAADFGRHPTPQQPGHHVSYFEHPTDDADETITALLPRCSSP
ncbi:hypothetical protein RM844_14740 [Streptomyces sp. DSM 44915]|uniref:Uncharacterized protein n=1 Tax=Streptomyces chisholmiae TaxID=3075540 RepID=A0ABU2JSS2_9ACTN|nr:hypothetical protein [Streptomyces sp. DSM 44915]MDT0267544.1 hypothetical protein [Streptomyces sp. DSM 44915]